MKQTLTIIAFSLLSIIAKAQWFELGGTNNFSNTWPYSGQIKGISVGPYTSNVYVSGDFGNVSTPEITKFDAASSSWIQAGIFSTIISSKAICVIKNNTNFGAIAAWNYYGQYSQIRAFNGATWDRTGDSLGTYIYDIIEDRINSNIYYCGGGSFYNGSYFVAKWNGLNWVELGGNGSLSSVIGTSQLLCISVDNFGNVYGAGNLTNSLGQTGIVKFNGANWQFIPFNNNGTIFNIKCDKMGNVYAAGDFTNTMSNKYVAKYNGASWSELGGTNALHANGTINSVSIDKRGSVFAAGYFTNTVGKEYVAKFINNTWYELGGVNSLKANNIINIITLDTLDNVLAGGYFTNASGLNYVAEYLNQPTIHPINASICSGNTYNFFGRIISTTGVYYDTIVNRFACDSISILNLFVKPNTARTITTSICQGSSYTVGSSTYNTTGTFIKHLPNYLGCDSTVTLNLTVNQNSAKTITASVCQGNSYTIGSSTYNTTGTFVAHLTNYVGCDSAVTLNLTVTQLPNPSISSTNCSLTCNPVAASYQWYLGGVIIVGATTQNILATQNGNYSVKVTDTNGCTNTSAPVYINCTTGINELASQATMTMVPNPCSTCELILTMPTNSFQNPNSFLQITDVIGKQVAVSFEKTSKGYLLLLKDATQGVYFIKNTQTQQVIKFVKE
jgi:hypothetical protein